MTIAEGFKVGVVRAEDFPAPLFMPGNEVKGGFQSSFSSEGDVPAPEDVDDSLDEAAETERDYVRRRLRDETGREPSEEEMDEWLRRHTEGY